MVVVVAATPPPAAPALSAAAASSSSSPPFSSSPPPWRSSFPSARSRGLAPARFSRPSRVRLCTLRAALVEAARQRPPAVVTRDGTVGGEADTGSFAIQLADRGNGAASSRAFLPSSRDRAEDMQAETRAMVRAAGATVYSPQLLAAKYGSRPIKVALRTLEILTTLGKFAVKLLRDQRSGQFDRRKRVRAVELRGIFTRLGPTFVKIGQGLSTRPDICPPEYLEELSELQHAVTSSPPWNAQRRRHRYLSAECPTPSASLISPIGRSSMSSPPPLHGTSSAANTANPPRNVQRRQHRQHL